MLNAYGHNYWNSSFITDVAMGQIPRSTEGISSFLLLFVVMTFWRPFHYLIKVSNAIKEHAWTVDVLHHCAVGFSLYELIRQMAGMRIACQCCLYTRPQTDNKKLRYREEHSASIVLSW